MTTGTPHDTAGAQSRVRLKWDGMRRTQDFRKIAGSLTQGLCLSAESALVACSPALDVLQELPGACISLILTDPPYHSTKKKNIHGDTAFDHDREYIAWLHQHAQEWRRILKPNGSLYLFCASEMAARIEVMLSEQFNVLSTIVWTKPNDPGFDGWKGKMKKEALRQWYPHSERIIFAEPAVQSNLHRSPFGELLRRSRAAAGLTLHQLTGAVGAYGRINHGGAVSNWETGRNIPSREQYDRICRALAATGKGVRMPKYEDAIRPFSVDATREFTDVWNFKSVRPYNGKHPAEKPVELLSHAISASTYPGDIVLDCFAGSGSTGAAAVGLGRLAILVEVDAKWATRAASRVAASGVSGSADGVIAEGACYRSSQTRRARDRAPQFELFAASHGGA